MGHDGVTACGTHYTVSQKTRNPTHVDNFAKY